QAGAKELWNACKQCGHVVDAFIPDRRSKIGKRFGFVRFIKVFDAERVSLIRMGIPRILVIGDDCVNQEDYSFCLNGKVKEFGSLSNLKVVLGNEGFNELGIRYLGGFDFVVDGRVAWMEVEGIPLKVWTDNTFKRIASKWGSLLSIDNYEEDCYHNKRMCIFTADMVNIFESFKIIYQGKKVWVRAKEVPGWSPEFKEQLDEDSEPEDDIFGGLDKPNNDNNEEEFKDENVVPGMVFDDGSVKHFVVDNSSGNQGNKSEDPFDLYSLLNKNKGEKNKNSNCSESLKFPPSFIPSVEKEVGCNMDKLELNCDNLNGGASNQGDHVNAGINNSYSKREGTESVGSGCFKKGDALRTGGTILTVMDELIKSDTAACGSNDMLNLMYKLKNLKKKIRGWNSMRQIFKNSKIMLKSKLGDVELVIDERNASKEQRLNGRLMVMRIPNTTMEFLVKKEQSSYSWGVGIRKMDRKSKFGKKKFLNHFKNRFGRPNKMRPVLVAEFPCQLNSMQRMDMKADVTIKEIKNAVWDCGTDMSPEPDGFSFDFYRRFWFVIQKDVVAAVKCFFHYGSIPKGCNSSFIALIPKILDVKMVKDFRPISLIGSLYKIIAKILANRLVTVLGDVINEIQLAFVADRQILDGPFILNEVLRWCKLKKKQSFIFKIDLEKAYDSVRWDYLEDVLKKFGFREKWCKWIRECLRSFWGSVIVNGSPTEEFQVFKGLKQGDPLSPFLFILIMESLYLTFQNVEDAGMFKGIVLNSSMVLSHMFFANDAVFVGQWSNSNLDTIIFALKCFERAFGLCMNMPKSKIMGISVNGDKVDQVAHRIDCGILEVPFTYLGSKVGECMSRIQNWNDVVENMSFRLSK
nr:RNA-directed DNA polymerase, eukaryota, reverse transcriptase zinc-binding domain protein [Tanacetum cinerariifolium]